MKYELEYRQSESIKIQHILNKIDSDIKEFDKIKNRPI
jgi:hypothetical protein